MKLGPYEVRTELARTPRAVLARAAAPSGTEVAITLVRADAAAFGRFERERRIIEALSSADGFLPVIDAGLSEAGAWFAQPLLHGGTLRDALSAGELPVEQIVRLVRGAASALARAHDRGLIHGELAPESIFVSDGQPFIGDLVLARYFPSSAKPAPFAAPEVAQGPATARSDVFSLAVILREALAGASPRREVAQAIERATLPDPARRFEDARGFLRALGGGVGPAVPMPTRVDDDDAPPPIAPVYPDPPRPRPAARSTRGLLTVALVSTVVLALGAVVFVELRHRAAESKERRFFELALAEKHDAPAALRAADALPESVRAKPQVQITIASLRSEVRAAEARASSLAALAKLTDETPGPARLEAAERALAADPRSARALVERARARLVVGRGATATIAAAREAAREDLERAIALDGSLGLARFELARLLARSKEGRLRARAELDKVASLEPDSAFGLVAKGEVALLDGKYEDALAAFSLAIVRRNPPHALLARARLRLDLDRDAKGALEDATRALELAPSSTLALEVRARAKAKLATSDPGDRRERRGEVTKLPLEDLDRAIELDPACASARGVRALYRHRSGDAKGGVDDANAALELDASDPEALVAAAELLVLAPGTTIQLVADRSRMEQAHQRLAEALDRDPGHVEALVVDTLLCLALQDFPACLERTERGLALQPGQLTFAANRATALAQLGRRDEAIAVLDKAIEAQPDADGLWFLRGKMKIERQPTDFPGAVDDLSRVIAKRKPPMETWFYRAYALHQLGRYREAIEDYDQAERVMPNSPVLARIRAYREDARARLGGR